MTTVTRFAPSPTGFLHIGGARTALFNWLFARHHGGKFLVRIEDTDRERSSQEAVDKILSGLKWLGLEGDEAPTYQFQRANRHQAVALELLNQSKAYKCYCTHEDLETKRAQAVEEKRSPKYDQHCRTHTEQQDKPFVIRLMMPNDGITTIHDQVQGTVKVENNQLDDMVLLRTDGTPTYMLSVVVDDHDMGITHVIRGSDHLTNTFRQVQLYVAMGWGIPSFSHIPLIHGADGAKLSKRHGALGVEAYEAMGILPETMCNYLLRLGWGHGDEEIISRDQAIEWFDVPNVGKAASRFDMLKLLNLNGHYIRQADNQRLVDLITTILEKKYTLSQTCKQRLLQGMDGLKMRAKTLLELAEQAEIYVKTKIDFDEKSLTFRDESSKDLVIDFANRVAMLNDWSEKSLEDSAREFSIEKNTSLGKIAQPLRAALTGRVISPSVFNIMNVLGKHESLERFRHW